MSSLHAENSGDVKSTYPVKTEHTIIKRCNGMASAPTLFCDVWETVLQPKGSRLLATIFNLLAAFALTRAAGGVLTMSTVERVIAAANGWLATPYRHQASTKGVGCDCLGLIRGVWREIYGKEPEQPEPYARDWAERGVGDRLRAAAERHFGLPIERADARPGDVLLFRWRADMPAKHLGILIQENRFIHAYEQAGVISSALVPSWARRVAFIYRFPEI